MKSGKPCGDAFPADELNIVSHADGGKPQHDVPLAKSIAAPCGTAKDLLLHMTDETEMRLLESPGFDRLLVNAAS